MDNRKSSTGVNSYVLVSACLLGEPVRYDGNSKRSQDKILTKLFNQNRVIAFCPEVAGGLPTPCPPAEIQSIKHLRVTTEAGENVTEAFVSGALQALKLCQQHDIKVAVLTELSPSCGSTLIYNGQFNRQKVEGVGITTHLLRQHDIQVFNQYQFDCARAIADSFHHP